MPDVYIVGAGLAGLCCATHLAHAGLSVTLYEASDAVGGRVRTDEVDGFRIDRGFQVLLTAYPEARRMLDMEALRLQPFDDGALVWTGSGFDRVSDPFRHPMQALASLTADVGSLADKLRVLRLRRSVSSGSLDDLWLRPEITTMQALRGRYGFSEAMIERFFRPFLGGILLDRHLTASSRAFEVYFRLFSQGHAAVPARGMQAIPEQIASGLPQDALRLNTRVTAVSPDGLTLEDGQTVSSKAVVVATDADAAASLLGDVPAPAWRSTTCLSWDTEAPPISDPVLLLDGTGGGPVNNVQVMSQVAPTYAPTGRHLVSASVIGVPEASDEVLEAEALGQLRTWFGDQVDGWRLLRIDRVPQALPVRSSLQPRERPPRLAPGLYVAGDHRRNGSINAAMISGRHTAEAILHDLGASASLPGR